MIGVFLGLCALYELPGPPVLNFQNGSWQAYTPNRRLCPRFDPFRDTIFELYTRQNPTHPHILYTGDPESVRSSYINFELETILFFHGFLESSESDDAVQIRRNYLALGDYNVIIVNNQRLLAGPDYVTAAGNCLPIGRYSARFVDFLVAMGLNLQHLHIIGLSLGGQIAGLTGKHIKSGRVQRITALDPAGPLFKFLPENERISPNDAEFVDIIHTSNFGMPIPCGKADIWVNSAIFQPGCSPLEVVNRVPGSITELIFCSHYQSLRMYIFSIKNSTAYIIKKCRNYGTYLAGECEYNEYSYLGIDITPTSRGNFFISIGPTALDV